MLRITANEIANEGGNRNISSSPFRALEEAWFPELPAVPSGWDKSSHAGRVDCKLKVPVCVQWPY